MVLSINIDVPIRKNASEATRSAQRRRMRDAMERGWADAQERLPEDRGTLRHSTFEPEWRSDGSIAYGSAAAHAGPMEYGTGPFNPPLEPLLSWSERVTGDPGLGYYVALHKIPEEGIDAQPFLRPSTKAVKQWLNSRSFSDYLSDEI